MTEQLTTPERGGSGTTGASPRQLSHRMTFVNLGVADIERTTAFWTALGFTLDPRFSDERCACLEISELSYVMLLREDFFRTFLTGKQLADTGTHNEVAVALSCFSRDEVDELVERALAAGGAPAGPSLDQGFMYGWSFQDPDGHVWELTWMDPAAVPPQA
jgi:predicted lactoylglutathione lyase